MVWTRFFVHLVPFLVPVLCSIYSSLSVPSATRLFGHSIAITDDLLFIDDGYATNTTTEFVKTNTNTIAIDLTTKWSTRTFRSKYILHHKQSSNVWGSMWYSVTDKRLYKSGRVGNANSNPRSARKRKTSEEIAPLYWLPVDKTLSNASFWRTLRSAEVRGHGLPTAGTITASSPEEFFTLGGRAETNPANDIFLTHLGLKSFSMQDKAWTTRSSKNYSSGFGSDGHAVYVPNYAAAGILVFIGGITPPSNHYEKNTKTAPTLLKDLSTIYIYDIAAGRFLHQQATNAPGGSIPKPRVEFEIVGVEDSNGGGYDIFMYGGHYWWSLLRRNWNWDDYTSVWVLSLPSFQWTKIPGSATAQNRLDHKMGVVGNRQMAVVGGIGHFHLGSLAPPDLWPGGIGIFDMVALRWKDYYDPDAKPYKRPRLLSKGRQFPSRWDSPEVEQIFSPKPVASGGANIGAIAGAAVGAAVALGLILLFTWLIVRKRKIKALKAKASLDSFGELPDDKDHWKLELPDDNDHSRRELSGTPKSNELPTRMNCNELPAPAILSELPTSLDNSP